jgi:putative toxin-antitoxin system antitoxin component (TIGR02293 family)
MSSADVLPFTEAELNDHAKMALLVTKGIDIRTLFRLGEDLGLSSQETADLLGISKSTLDRRRKAKELLRQEESERVWRFLRLYTKALAVFKTKEAAVQWLSTQIRALGDKTPMEFAKTEPGARLVEDILGRILEGVFS